MSDQRIRRRYQAKSVVIAQGASLSAELNTDGLPLAGIIMPAAWTSANLTFQAADKSSGTFANVYDGAGTELNVTAGASRSIGLTTSDMDALGAFQYMKIRSGTAGTPVTQGGARTIIAILRS